MRLAAAGEPDKLLTLTCSPKRAPHPTDAARLLHDAWRTLRLRIARELMLPAGMRWSRQANDRRDRRAELARRWRQAHREVKPASLPYFAIVEPHQSGHPHLHILLRSDYVPQRWLSRQMKELAASPIVDIRKIKSPQSAASYVAKYLTKSNKRFDGCRRYWYTRNYNLHPDTPDLPTDEQKGWFHAHRRRWEETRAEVDTWRPVIDVTSDLWFSFRKRAAPMGAYVVKGRHAPIWKRTREPPNVAG